MKLYIVWDCLADMAVSEAMPEPVAKIALEAKGGAKNGFLLVSGESIPDSQENAGKGSILATEQGFLFG